MITVYLSKGERLELREAVEARGEDFMGSKERGVAFVDARGGVLAQFRVAEIAGFVDDVERSRRQVESYREQQARGDGQSGADTGGGAAASSGSAAPGAQKTAAPAAAGVASQTGNGAASKSAKTASKTQNSG